MLLEGFEDGVFFDWLLFGGRRGGGLYGDVDWRAEDFLRDRFEQLARVRYRVGGIRIIKCERDIITILLTPRVREIPGNQRPRLSHALEKSFEVVGLCLC